MWRRWICMASQESPVYPIQGEQWTWQWRSPRMQGVIRDHKLELLSEVGKPGHHSNVQQLTAHLAHSHPHRDVSSNRGNLSSQAPAVCYHCIVIQTPIKRPPSVRLSSTRWHTQKLTTRLLSCARHYSAFQNCSHPSFWLRRQTCKTQEQGSTLSRENILRKLVIT